MLIQGTLLKKASDAYHPAESLNVLNKITFEKLVEFEKEWLKTIRTEW